MCEVAQNNHILSRSGCASFRKGGTGRRMDDLNAWLDGDENLCPCGPDCSRCGSPSSRLPLTQLGEGQVKGSTLADQFKNLREA